MEKANEIFEKFKNPALWLTILASLFWVSIRLNNVDVLESRLNKKIEVQNEMHKEIDEIKLMIKDEKIERLEDKIEILLKINSN